MSCISIYEKIYFNDTVVYSIVTPIYNQEKIIVNNIKSYINNTSDNFEIILIIDSCSDKTKENILNFFETYINNNKNFIQIKIFETSEPFFETKCDNFGFKLSEGKYLLEIQADMEMTELGYNKYLTKPFNNFTNIIAVSGRCAHNFYRSGGVGKLGGFIEKDISELNVNRDYFYQYETCNRGPLLLDKNKVKELNYLNEEKFFLNNSDHDLMIRAYLNYHYICGYIPINFKADLKNGSTRKKKDEKNESQLKIMEKKVNNLGGDNINNYLSRWKNLQPKIYNLNNIKNIIFNFENENGIFSVFFFFLQTYIYCRKNNIFLYVKDDKWKFKNNNGLDDYLVLNSYIKKFDLLDNSNNIFFTHNNTPNISCSLEDYKIYSKEVFNIDKKILIDYKLPKNYNSIFIRGGDKLLYEAKKIPIKEYVDKLIKVDKNTKNIFVHSDDNLLVEEVEIYIRNNNIDLNVFKITDSNNNGGAVVMKRLNYGVCKHIKSVDNMNNEEIKRHTNLFLNAIEIMKNSNNIICSFDSNVSRFMKINFDNNVYTVNGNNNIDFGKITKNPAHGF